MSLDEDESMVAVVTATNENAAAVRVHPAHDTVSVSLVFKSPTDALEFSIPRHIIANELGGVGRCVVLHDTTKMIDLVYPANVMGLDLALVLHTYLSSIAAAYEKNTVPGAARVAMVIELRQRLVQDLFARLTWTQRMRMVVAIDFYCTSANALSVLFIRAIERELEQRCGLVRAPPDDGGGDGIGTEWLCQHAGGGSCRRPHPVGETSDEDDEAIVEWCQADIPRVSSQPFAHQDYTMCMPPLPATVVAAATTKNTKRPRPESPSPIFSSPTDTDTKRIRTDLGPEQEEHAFAEEEAAWAAAATAVAMEVDSESDSSPPPQPQQKYAHEMHPQDLHSMLQLAHTCHFYACSYRPIFALDDRGNMQLHPAYETYWRAMPRVTWKDWQWVELMSRTLIRLGRLDACLIDLFAPNASVAHLTRDTQLLTNDAATAKGNKVFTLDPPTVCADSWIIQQQQSTDAVIPCFVDSQAAFWANLVKFVNLEHSLGNGQGDRGDHLQQLMTMGENDPEASIVCAGGSVARNLASSAAQRWMGLDRSSYQSDCDFFIVGTDSAAKERLFKRVLAWFLHKLGFLPVVGVLPGVFTVLLPRCRRFMQFVISDTRTAAELIFHYDFGYIQCALWNGRVVATPGFVLDAMQGTATVSRLPFMRPFSMTRVAKAIEKRCHVPAYLRGFGKTARLDLAGESKETREAIGAYRRHYLHWNPDVVGAKSTDSADRIEWAEDRRQQLHLLSMIIMKPENVGKMRSIDSLLLSGDELRFQPDSAVYFREFSSFFHGTYCMQDPETIVPSLDVIFPVDEDAKDKETEEEVSRKKPTPLYLSQYTRWTPELEARLDALVDGSEFGAGESGEENSKAQCIRLGQQIYFIVDQAYLVVGETKIATEGRRPHESAYDYQDRLRDAKDLYRVALAFPTSANVFCGVMQRVMDHFLQRINAHRVPRAHLHWRGDATKPAEFAASARFPFSTADELVQETLSGMHVLQTIKVRGAQHHAQPGTAMRFHGLLRMRQFSFEKQEDGALDTYEPVQLVPLFESYSYRAFPEQRIALAHL